MPEPQQNPPENRVVRWLKRTPYADLPWDKVLRKPMLLAILLPIAALALLTVPDIALISYKAATEAGGGVLIALLKAAGFVALTLAFWALFGVIMLLGAASIWSLTLELIKLGKILWQGLQALPGALAATGRWLLALPSTCAKVARTIKQSSFKGRAFAAYLAVTFGLLGTLVYFGWAPASYLCGKLPDWLIIDSFMRVWVTLIIDIWASVMVWAILVSLLNYPVVAILRFFRPKE